MAFCIVQNTLVIVKEIFYMTTGDIVPNITIGPKQFVRINSADTAFEACTIYDQPDWNQTSPTALDFIKNKPTIPGTVTRSYSSPSRTLNSAFQPSTTRDAQVSYSVDIATSVSLAGGAVGTVFLEYADDSGFTTGVTEVGRTVNGNTGTLVDGLTLNQTATAQLNGIIPASKYVRLRTANTTGSPTFTFRSSQEVLL